MRNGIVSLKAIHDAYFALMTNPPYSPDLAPQGSFYLLPKLKDCIRGTRFESESDATTAVQELSHEK